jgi:hypothetical protein
MRVLLLPVLLLAACTQTAVPITPDELALREAAAVRGSDFDLALFCGADPARIVDAAKVQQPPAYLNPTLTRNLRELLVARVLVTKNLRGSNADNPDCIALKSRPDLARFWAPVAPRSPQPRPTPS